MPRTVPRKLQDEPASYRLVYLAIANSEAPLTLEEVIDGTGSARPTVKEALATLQRRGAVEADEHAVDARRRAYRLADTDDVDTAEVSA